METIFLFATLALASGVGFVILWRRQRAADREIARLRLLLESLERDQVGAWRQVRVGERVSEKKVVALPGAGRIAPRPTDADATSHEFSKGLVLAFAAAAPAAGAFFQITPAWFCSVGVLIGAAMMVLALRRDWSAAAWTGASVAAGWALAALLLAQNSTFVALAMGAAGASGLLYAKAKGLLPGAAMAFAMTAAVLWGGASTTMISAYGAAFLTLVAIAAVVGATALRLEGLHFAAFAAALMGLYVLSGQPDAAIWFTPAASWSGALFFAVMAVRVPQAGSRGASFAGTGTLAPIAAVAALHDARHALAAPGMAGLALVLVALAIGAVIALCAQRRTLSSLRLSHWIMGVGAFVAASGGFILAIPPPATPLAFAMLAAALIALSARFDQRLWRVLACAAAGMTLLESTVVAGLILSERAPWPAWWGLAAAAAAPAAGLFGGAYLARRLKFTRIAGVFDIAALAGMTLAANLAARLIFSAGATLLQPVGFAEAGVHVTIWLTAALLIAPRQSRIAEPAALLLSAFALAGLISAAGVWLPPTWRTSGAALGFLIPSLGFWAHWVFWRGRGRNLSTRLSLGAAAATGAGYLTLEMLQQPAMPTWALIILCGAAFACAVAINFAPGVTSPRAAREHRARRAYARN
mgnify:CR=1 FL=1